MPDENRDTSRSGIPFRSCGNTSLVSTYHARMSVLESVADAGLEQARSALNGIDSLYPDSGYVTYESGVAVTDASGATIPGVTRTTYIGRVRNLARLSAEGYLKQREKMGFPLMGKFRR